MPSFLTRIRSRSIRFATGTLAVVLILSGCAREDRIPTLLGGRDVRSWLDDLHATKATVRRHAVLKLGNVGDADPAVVGGLIAALDDSDPLVRRDAIVAVTRLKDPGASAWERIRKLSQSDTDARTRDLAKQAIARRPGGG